MKTLKKSIEDLIAQISDREKFQPHEGEPWENILSYDDIVCAVYNDEVDFAINVFYSLFSQTCEWTFELSPKQVRVHTLDETSSFSSTLEEPEDMARALVIVSLEAYLSTLVDDQKYHELKKEHDDLKKKYDELQKSFDQIFSPVFNPPPPYNLPNGLPPTKTQCTKCGMIFDGVMGYCCSDAGCPMFARISYGTSNQNI